ncbi:MAG TPA: hypothetical protein VGM43_18900 [Bryobacteraceae bacterium]
MESESCPVDAQGLSLLAQEIVIDVPIIAAGALRGFHAEHKNTFTSGARPDTAQVFSQLTYGNVAFRLACFRLVQIPAIEPLAHHYNSALPIDVFPLQAEHFGNSQRAEERHHANQPHVFRQGVEQLPRLLVC